MHAHDLPEHARGVDDGLAAIDAVLAAAIEDQALLVGVLAGGKHLGDQGACFQHIG